MYSHSFHFSQEVVYNKLYHRLIKAIDADDNGFPCTIDLSGYIAQ